MNGCPKSVWQTDKQTAMMDVARYMEALLKVTRCMVCCVCCAPMQALMCLSPLSLWGGHGVN